MNEFSVTLGNTQMKKKTAGKQTLELINNQTARFNLLFIQ
jgi:hypothetical protein